MNWLNILDGAVIGASALFTVNALQWLGRKLKRKPRATA